MFLSYNSPMHWTSTLARRAFAPQARVIEDLDCAGCGYNLRGLEAGSRCPECSRAVADSLYVLRQADRVASALRTLARAYAGLASVALLGVGAVLGSVGLVWIGVALLGAAAIFRLTAMTDLRFRSDLENLPVIGGRLTLLWGLAAAELFCVFVSGVLLYLISAGSWAIDDLLNDLFRAAVMAWLLVVVVAALITGLVGFTLGMALGYGSLEREFLIQRWLIAGGLVAALLLGFVSLLLILAGAMEAARAAQLGAAGVLLLAWAVALAYTVVGLLHLGSAAERDRDIREEVVESDVRPAIGAGTPRPERDLPEIPLAESDEADG